MRFEGPKIAGDISSEENPAELAEKKPIFTPEDRELLREAADSFIDQAHEQKFDSLVFLDRSARIFAHLILERWKARFSKEQTPDLHFIKVGREMGTYNPKYGGFDGYYRASEGDKLKYAQQLREIFQNPRTSSSYFAGKKVLIADEYAYSGATLKFAKEIFEKAFGMETEGVGTGALWMGRMQLRNSKSMDVDPVAVDSDHVPISATPQSPIFETPNEVISHTKQEILPKKISEARKKFWLSFIPGFGTGEASKLDREQRRYEEDLKQTPEQTKEYMAAVKEIKEIAREEIPVED